MSALAVVMAAATHSLRSRTRLLALVASELVAHEIVPLDLRVERPTVEDAFLALTGRDVRE